MDEIIKKLKIHAAEEKRKSKKFIRMIKKISKSKIKGELIYFNTEVK